MNAAHDSSTVEQEAHAGVAAVRVTVEPPAVQGAPTSVDGNREFITVVLGPAAHVLGLERLVAFMVVHADYDEALIRVALMQLAKRWRAALTERAVRRGE